MRGVSVTTNTSCGVDDIGIVDACAGHFDGGAFELHRRAPRLRRPTLPPGRYPLNERATNGGTAS